MNICQKCVIFRKCLSQIYLMRNGEVCQKTVESFLREVRPKRTQINCPIKMSLIKPRAPKGEGLVKIPGMQNVFAPACVRMLAPSGRGGPKNVFAPACVRMLAPSGRGGPKNFGYAKCFRACMCAHVGP